MFLNFCFGLKNVQMLSPRDLAELEKELAGESFELTIGDGLKATGSSEIYPHLRSLQNNFPLHDIHEIEIFLEIDSTTPNSSFFLIDVIDNGNWNSSNNEISLVFKNRKLTGSAAVILKDQSVSSPVIFNRTVEGVGTKYTSVVFENCEVISRNSCKKGGDHDVVNMGFRFQKMICRKCDTEFK